MRVLLLLILLIATPANAATPRAKPPLAPGQVVRVPETSQVVTAGPGCSVGVTGPAVYVIDYILPPDDSYYMLARPSTCGPCSALPGVWVSAVQVTLEFRVPCSQPVEVSVVSAVADTACAPPHPPRVLRGPVSSMLTAVTPGIHNFSVPLEGGVALLKDTYLRVTFPTDGAGCTAEGTRPRLVTSSSCNLCLGWNFYSDFSDDLCALLFPGNLLIHATADSCVSASLLGVWDRPGASANVRVRPNPSRDGAEVRFSLASGSHVRVEVCDVAGRRIRALLDEQLPAGEHDAHWDGRDERGERVRPGTYFAVVREGPSVRSRRMVLLGLDR